MRFLRRRWKLLIVAVVVAIGVGVVAIPYIYIHFINKPAPRLTFENRDKERARSGDTMTGESAAETAAAATSSLDGNWKVSSGTAGYRVKETLNGQATEGVGRTPKVEGSFTLAGTSVTAGEFSIDVSSLESDQTRRDNQVRTRLLNTAEFPVSTFVLDKPIDLGPLPADGVTISVSGTGTLSLQARRAAETIEVVANAPITFADFGIEDPSVSPFVSVGPVGTLEVSLVLGRTTP